MFNKFATQETPSVIFDHRPVACATGQCDACPPTLPILAEKGNMFLANEYYPAYITASLELDKGMHLVCTADSSRPALLNDQGWELFSRIVNQQPITGSLAGTACGSFGQSLIAAGLLLPGSRNATPKEQNHILTAWLHLTDRCNLRCSYCYLPHVLEDMSLETGYVAMDAIFRSALAHGFKQVKIKYAGGEPLLCFATLITLHTYAQQLAETHRLDLDGVILSNGTLLTVEMVEMLKTFDLRLMISLDGLGNYHDSHRPYASGRGTFADVSEAIDLALAHGVVPDISVTVSNRTADGLAEVISWILDRDLPFSLNFYRENELSTSYTDMQLKDEKIIHGVLAAYKVIEKQLPQRSLLAALIDRANLAVPHIHTCGVGQNYLVFDQNGKVAKCQMQIHKPLTDLDAADPLAFIRADQGGIQNLPVMEKEGCKTCEWKHWCTGGCPLETHRVTGRYDVKSPNCNIYKALFPEALRLEGLRLWKYQDNPEVVTKL